MTNITPYDEINRSQLPAIKDLVNMGWKYISIEEALKQRGTDRSNVILEKILKNQLSNINGNKFDEQGIGEAMRKLKLKGGGVMENNKSIYNLLSYGTNIPVANTEHGYRELAFKYIDWNDISKNTFHCTAEFSVSEGMTNCRADIVLFVNGIPLCLIECKAPDIRIEEAISQVIGYERKIPNLFAYLQILISVNSKDAKYASVGAIERFWFRWKEQEFLQQDVHDIVVHSINTDTLSSIHEDLREGSQLDKTEQQSSQVEITLSNQTNLLFSLCKHDRFLDLIKNFILFEDNSKKLTRYHQYFLVKEALNKAKQKDENGVRKGGVVWHTQGSGKTITMVFLTLNLQRSSGIKNPLIILVSDRVELNDQISELFDKSGLTPKQVVSGKELMGLVTVGGASVITTNVHKFHTASKYVQEKNLSADIFVLVDECHRTQYGTMASDMRHILPKGCYIGFTGTPLLEKEKRNTFNLFGDFIEPTYPISQALNDNAVVPLFYEERHSHISQNETGINRGTELAIAGLDEKNANKLKKELSHLQQIHKTKDIIKKRAADICMHYISFTKQYSERVIKAQLIAPDKATAIKYHKEFKEINQVSTKVIISSPAEIDSHKNITDEDLQAVKDFWEEEVMNNYRSEKEYTKAGIKAFKDEVDPQILIVVDKLTTGFDAPNNTILYMCDKRKEHGLLQVIARVNRIDNNKDSGFIIDYTNIFGELQEALNTYEQLSGYSSEDIEETLIPISQLIKEYKASYSELLEIFKKDKHTRIEYWESMELKMHHPQKRKLFYKSYLKFDRSLSAIISSPIFIKNIPDDEWEQLKKNRKYWKRFYKSITNTYRESPDLSKYRNEIKNVMDEHISAGEIKQLGEAKEIFPANKQVSEDLQDDYTYTPTEQNNNLEVRENSKDKLNNQEDYTMQENSPTIYLANLIKMLDEVHIKIEQDPKFYQQMSVLIQQSINKFNKLSSAYENNEISRQEYIARTSNSKNFEELKQKIVSNKTEDAPQALEDKTEARAYYDILNKKLNDQGNSNREQEKCLCEAAITIKEILEDNKSPQEWKYIDTQKEIKRELLKVLWGLEDNPITDFLKDKTNKIAESMMVIAQARAKAKITSIAT